MKKSNYLIVAILCFLTFNIGMAEITHDPVKEGKVKADFVEDMIAVLSSQKDYTLQVINQMPEDKFDFRPAEGARSYGELFKHITGSLKAFLKIVNGEFTSPQEEFGAVVQFEKQAMSKQEIITVFTTEIDNAIAILKKMTDKDLNKTFDFAFFPGAPVKDNRQIYISIRDHITHHRAQATVYLRINGIKPAPFRPW